MIRLLLRLPILIVVNMIIFFPLTVDAGIEVPTKRELHLIEKGEAPRRISWAKHRVAVFSYDDKQQTGLANDVSLILAREILFNSGVSSLGVLNFTEDLSPEDLNELSYFDKVEKITEKEEVTFSVWGRILPVRNKLLIDTFIQLPPNVLDKHFMWKLRLPRAMGGAQLQAHLRPDRIHLQSLSLSQSAASDIKSAARSLRILRRDPRKDSPIVTEIPEEKVYSIIERQGDWVFLKIRNGPEGWTPARGHCTELCAPLIEAGRFAGGILQYVASGRLRNATDNLTTEALAVEEQIKALDGLNAASSKQIYERSLKRALRWTGPNRWTGKDKWTKIDRGSGIPPGGAAFANVKALAELAIKLHNAYGATSSGRLYREFLEYKICLALQRHYDKESFGEEMARQRTQNIDRLCSLVDQLLRGYPENLSTYDLQRFLSQDLGRVVREFQSQIHHYYDYRYRSQELEDSLVQHIYGRARQARQLSRESLGAITCVALMDELYALERAVGPRAHDLRKACRLVRRSLERYPAALSEQDIQELLVYDLRIVLREFDPRHHISHSELVSDIAKSLSASFDDIRLRRPDVRPIAVELAKASVEDPKNVDILKNLAVLFTFLGDSYRAEIANSLAKEMKQ